MLRPTDPSLTRPRAGQKVSTRPLTADSLSAILRCCDQRCSCLPAARRERQCRPALWLCPQWQVPTALDVHLLPADAQRRPLSRPHLVGGARTSRRSPHHQLLPPGRSIAAGAMPSEENPQPIAASVRCESARQTLTPLASSVTPPLKSAGTGRGRLTRARGNAGVSGEPHYPSAIGDSI